MKIAFATNDGKTVSQHFGRSRYFKIFEITNNKISNQELRERCFGHHSQSEHHQHNHSEGLHGTDHQHDHKHDQMAGEIADCQIMICGGMGYGAYSRLVYNGINVILTDERDIEQALSRYLSGNLPNLVEQRTH